MSRQSNRLLTLSVSLSLLVSNAPFLYAADPPLVESFLVEGKLADGQAALVKRLAESPQDDQARFGLGVVQFLQGFETAGGTLYRYGLRSERAIRGTFGNLNQVVPQNPKPDPISYDDLRTLIKTFVDDMNAAEATLATIKDPAVKLPLHVGLIKFHPTGQGKPISAKIVLGQNQPEIPPEAIDSFVIGFDRGDVCWLRGYLHLLAAWGEVLLAVDGREMFETTAHIFFEKPVTPHTFLLRESREIESIMRWDTRMISDIVAFFHVMRFPIKEPARMQETLKHLESAVAMSREMWTFYLQETDDEHEWIPNPRQTGVLQTKVSDAMVASWREVLDEADRVLKGERLLPFWRGIQSKKRGINLRRVFTEPKPLDPFLWWQGTAATPYLEDGEISKFADPKFRDALDDVYGPQRFWNFAIWFN